MLRKLCGGVDVNWKEADVGHPLQVWCCYARAGQDV